MRRSTSAHISSSVARDRLAAVADSSPAPGIGRSFARLASSASTSSRATSVAVAPVSTSSIASSPGWFPTIQLSRAPCPFARAHGVAPSAASSSVHRRTSSAFSSKRFSVIDRRRPCSALMAPRSAP